MNNIQLFSNLTILIATHNRLDQLKVTLESIKRETHTPYQIYVIDGGSTDGTVEYLYDKVDIIPVFQGKLLGPAKAYNDVWKTLDCEYTCWLSDDTEVVNGSLNTAVDILKTHPDIGMVGLKMKDTIGPWAQEPYMGSISALGILTCNHAVMRMRDLKKTGFFNESYHFYMIDPDLTASFLSLGKKVVLTKSISVLHHREWAVKNQDDLKSSKNKEENRAIYVSKFSFLCKKPSISNRYLQFFGELKHILIKIDKKILNYKCPDYLNYLLTNNCYISLVYLFKIQIFILIFHPILPLFRLKKIIWRQVEKTIYNIIFCKYVSLWDILLTWREEYHLIQKIPVADLKCHNNPYIETLNSFLLTLLIWRKC